MNIYWENILTRLKLAEMNHVPSKFCEDFWFYRGREFVNPWNYQWLPSAVQLAPAWLVLAAATTWTHPLFNSPSFHNFSSIVFFDNNTWATTGNIPLLTPLFATPPKARKYTTESPNRHVSDRTRFCKHLDDFRAVTSTLLCWLLRTLRGRGHQGINSIAKIGGLPIGLRNGRFPRWRIRS